MNSSAFNRRQFLALGAALALSACGGQRGTAARIPAGSTVLALGDSLTEGYGADAASAYPAVLSALSGWNVVNGGVSGDTSAQALARLPELLRQSPKLVVVSIGGNDFLRKLPENETRQNIREILAKVQAAGIPAVLVAVPYVTLGALIGSLSEHPLYADLAKEMKVPLLQDAWADILGDSSLRSDQIHANAQGYRVFAEKLYAFLKKQGFAA
ncbi:lysophospholipase L1-like esterase [Neisseria sp. HSC-16F19]|nr:arylesterase [Neisseria sp. HSC-16F19]MCP2040894.1 lysophospholipase L1-like esterase [Neisseria sp. HSC-16F19]